MMERVKPMPGLSEYKPGLDEIKAMKVETLVATWNAKVEPWYWDFPYIYDNDDDILDRIAEEKGGAWLAKAIDNGFYVGPARYLVVEEDVPAIWVFNTPEDFFKNVCTPEELAECWAQ